MGDGFSGAGKGIDILYLSEDTLSACRREFAKSAAALALAFPQHRFLHSNSVPRNLLLALVFRSTIYIVNYIRFMIQFA